MRKIFNVVILFLFFCWSYVIISDFIEVKNGNKASFCIRHTIYDYTDGSVEECMGLGYKVYYYNRSSVNIKTEFGPFWKKIKD